MLAVVVVLLLGSHLHIAGYSTIPLPWKLLDQSLLHDVIPLRLAVYMFLLVAVIGAMWLAQPRTGGWALGKWAVAAASIAFLVPNVSGGLWRGQEFNPAFFTTHQYRRVLARGETVLILPFGQLDNSMLWQADTDMWFRLAGGYINPQYPADYESDPLFPALFRNARPDPQTLRSFLSPSACGRGDRRSRNAPAVARGSRGARTEAHVAWRHMALPIGPRGDVRSQLTSTTRFADAHENAGNET